MEQKARLLRERQIGHTDDDGVSPSRSITVNVTEAPPAGCLRMVT